MNWVGSASDVERAQMKIIYAAMYVVVGIMPMSAASQIKVPSIISQFDDGDNTDSRQEWLGPPKESFDKSLKIPLSKRFKPIESLIPHATKHFKGLDKTTILAKWRWMYRDNCDKLVLRYIRQMGSSKKVMSAIGEALALSIGNFDPEVILRQGEAYYVFDKPSQTMMQQHECGKRVIAGHDKQNRPLNILTARRSYSSAQTYDEMEKFSRYLLELTYMMCQDDVDGAVIVFDMQGFKRANMDIRIMKFFLTQLNKVYPMMLHRIFVYRAPLSMQAIYKFLYSWLDASLRDRVRFISRPDDLLAVISASQLPTQLGGSSLHQHVWIPPNKDDDAPMRDTKTRNNLIEQREYIVKRLETVTKQWILAQGAQDISRLENQRLEILEELYRVYWLLDPYVRSRCVFDRNGIFGIQRPELKEGAVGQPVCKVQTPDQSLTGVPSAYGDHDTSTLVSNTDAMSISSKRRQGALLSAKPSFSNRNSHRSKA